MTRLTSIFSTALIVLTTVFAFGQGLEEELGFVYVKAEYLYETSRYEEAIVQYNQVITKSPKYKDALVHRGWSKYYLAAYKGSALDALQAIELNGITADAAALLGRSQAMLNDQEAAINSLSASVNLADNNAEFFEWRAELYEKKGDLIKACMDYEEAMKLGSKSAIVKAKSLCGVTASTSNNGPKRTVPSNPVPQNDNSSTQNDNNDNPVEPTDNPMPNTNPNDPVTNTDAPKVPVGTVPIGGGTTQDSMMVDDSDPVVRDENTPIEDNTVKTVEIDDDLTIEIYGQELGLRNITETPNILILNDQNGTVMVHICVNKAGVVTKAEFNPDFSTLTKKSIVSLALRKAKEFEFAPGKYDSQCGVMVFKVKGS